MINQGDETSPTPDPDCVELDNKIKNEEGQLPNAVKNVPHTTAAMRTKENGITKKTEWTCSNYSGMSAAQKKRAVAGQPTASAYPRTVTQCGQLHEHRKYRPKADSGCDCEARLLFDMKPASNTELIFKIRWQDQSGVHPGPCDKCFDLMCITWKYCGIKISVCNENNTKQEDIKDDCNNSNRKQGHKDFTKKLTTKT